MIILLLNCRHAYVFLCRHLRHMPVFKHLINLLCGVVRYQLNCNLLYVLLLSQFILILCNEIMLLCGGELCYFSIVHSWIWSTFCRCWNLDLLLLCFCLNYLFYKEFSYAALTYTHNSYSSLFPCSCYANAVLQCLAFTPPLHAYFLQGLHSKECMFMIMVSIMYPLNFLLHIYYPW